MDKLPNVIGYIHLVIWGSTSTNRRKSVMGAKVGARFGSVLSRLFGRTTEQSSELQQLLHLPRIEVSTTQLRSLSASDLARAFNNERHSSEWAELSREIDSIQPIPDMKTGGINPRNISSDPISAAKANPRDRNTCLRFDNEHCRRA
jgi:hypothetical protein